MSEIVRMNISVPKELRDEMYKFEGKVNWSAITANAFRKYISDKDGECEWTVYMYGVYLKRFKLTDSPLCLFYLEKEALAFITLCLGDEEDYCVLRTYCEGKVVNE